MTELEKEVVELTKDFDITERNNIAIQNLSVILEDRGLIDFSVSYREGESDSWLQAEYWDRTINHSIIVDYDFPDSFDSIKDLVATLDQTSKEVEKVKKQIANV